MGSLHLGGHLPTDLNGILYVGRYLTYCLAWAQRINSAAKNELPMLLNGPNSAADTVNKPMNNLWSHSADCLNYHNSQAYFTADGIGQAQWYI